MWWPCVWKRPILWYGITYFWKSHFLFDQNSCEHKMPLDATKAVFCSHITTLNRTPSSTLAYHFNKAVLCNVMTAISSCIRNCKPSKVSCFPLYYTRGVENLRSRYEAPMFQMGPLSYPEVAKMVFRLLKNWRFDHVSPQIIQQQLWE